MSATAGNSKDFQPVLLWALDSSAESRWGPFGGLPTPLGPVAVAVLDFGVDSDGEPSAMRTVTDAADDQEPINLQQLQAVVSRAQLWDGTLYQRERSVSADVQGAVADKTGVAVVAQASEFGVSHGPAAGVLATITRAAVAGARHVCRGISAGISWSTADTATKVVRRVRLRDGAGGTILWETLLGDNAAVAASFGVHLSGLSIVGGVNTAMVLEFDAAPSAASFEAVALSGYTAQA
jgi:hypothetical protein